MSETSDYFNAHAEEWGKMEPSISPVQPAVVALANIPRGGRVLDVGCGTGVMTRHYLEQGAGKVIGIDVAENMLAIARSRFEGESRVEFELADVAEFQSDDPFDAMVIYNAYPHLLDKKAVVDAAARLLAPGGRFVVAHGVGKQIINSRHHREIVPESITCGLKSAREEASEWEYRFEIDALVDTPRFYAFSGFLK